MTTASSPYQVHSAVRGPHWIAWITRGNDVKPDRSIVLIGASQPEAEANARRWADQQDY
jgi:hypothetical protein